jgi:plastocyanin
VSKRVWSLALVLGLVLAACGGSGKPSAEAVRTSFVPQTVDFLDNVGRGVSLALDKDGNPHMAYIGLVQVVAEGEIPPARPATAPALPAVLTASQKDGIFSHGFVVQTDISTANAPPLPLDASSSTGIAVGADGSLNVVWNQFHGVFFSSAPTDAAPFGEPQTVAEVYATSPAVAMDSQGNPWLAYVEQDGTSGALSLQVATLAGKKWTPSEEVADLGTCDPAACGPVKVAIAMDKDVPMVAFSDAGGTVSLATRGGSDWSTQTVEEGANGFGVSMAVDSKGSIHVAYATTTGDVRLAVATGPQGPWNVSTVSSYRPPKPSPTPSQSSPAASPSAAPSPAGSASTSPGPSASPEPPPALQPGTAVAVDPGKGTVYVAWTDPAAREVKLASGDSGGAFEDVATPGTSEGEFPAMAVSAEGKVDLAWYNSDAQDLELGTYPEKLEAIALPAPSTPATQPQQSGGGGESCPKDTVEFIAPPGAGGAGFDPNQVSAPSGDFTACFNNEDIVQHNVEIFTSESAAQSGAAPLARDEPFSGPKIDTFDVKGLTKGDYYFHCVIHPTTMTGALTVK